MSSRDNQKQKNSERLVTLSNQLKHLNSEMQTVLDSYEGKTDEGVRKIRSLKVEHDKILREFNELQR